MLAKSLMSENQISTYALLVSRFKFKAWTTLSGNKNVEHPVSKKFIQIVSIYEQKMKPYNIRSRIKIHAHVNSSQVTY